MPRSKKGEAIRVERRTGLDREALEALRAESRAKGDLATWRRTQAVVRYLEGRTVISLSADLGVGRSAINSWLRDYDTTGADGLRPTKAPGRSPRLSQAQRDELAEVIENGPQAAGFTSGMWTGPMIGQVILKKFAVTYHNHHVPRLLHQMGFSVQRPRKRLARADHEKQAAWLRDRLPEVKKKPKPVTAS